MRSGHRSVASGSGGLRRSGAGCMEQARIRTFKMTVVIGECIDFLYEMYTSSCNSKTKFISFDYLGYVMQLLIEKKIYFSFSSVGVFVLLDSVLRHFCLVVDRQASVTSQQPTPCR